MDVRDLLLRNLDEAFERRAWHGPNLLGALRGLDVEEALWRPASGRHNAWEVLLHCAYWKHRVRSRILDVPREPFPHPGRDWPRLPDSPSAAGWREDVALLRRTHAALWDAVASLEAEELLRPRAGLTVPRIQAVAGIAFHDIYHAGQIRLLRRLAAGGAA